MYLCSPNPGDQEHRFQANLRQSPLKRKERNRGERRTHRDSLSPLPGSPSVLIFGKTLKGFTARMLIMTL